MSLSSDDPRPPYVQIADALRSDIQAGRYVPGARLPTVDQLVERYGVAKATVQRGVDLLRQEGYIVAWQGRGTFVREILPSAEPGRDNPLDEVNRRIDELAEAIQELGEKVEQQEIQELRRNVARLENLLMDLYSRTNQQYPHQRPDDEQGRQRVGA